VINREVINITVMLTGILFCTLFNDVIFAENFASNDRDYDDIIEYSWSDSDRTSFDEEVFPHEQKKRIKKYSRQKSSRNSVKVKRPYGKTKHLSQKNYSRNKKQSHIKKRVYSSKRILRYRVKRRDTLYRISKRYNVPVSTICRTNKISDRGTIYAGMVLKIPVAGKSKSGVAQSKHTKKVKKKTKVTKKPVFRWPMNHVISYRKDGINGVKSIGITIKGRPFSTVYSSAAGTVKRVGNMRGYGNYIVVTHKYRFATVYANLEKVYVREGQTVRSGNMLGKIGSRKRILHFQIDHAGKPANPLQYLPKRS
jgi:murein DD-endopeptidase MepM/ murein hydrolase activator NlpD